jgi:hypothetical protein
VDAAERRHDADDADHDADHDHHTGDAGGPDAVRAPPVEAAALRHAACCRSEPECPLCPLLPPNVHVPLAERRRRGLYANLPRLGFP